MRGMRLPIKTLLIAAVMGVIYIDPIDHDLVEETNALLLRPC